MMSLLSKLCLFSVTLFSVVSFASDNDDVIEKANNPLHLAPAFSFQDYYSPEMYGPEQHINDALARLTLPIAPGDYIPFPQILRVTAPIATRPDPSGGYRTGLGDINLFDVFLLKNDGVKFGIGPLLTANSASHDEAGTGQWQAGAAAVVVNSTPSLMSGALMQWQKSFTGDNERSHVETATVQPVLIYKLSDGWFMRSSGVWNFNVKNGHYYIPVGLGGGRAFGMGKTIVNTFIEPQWTVLHEGDYSPKFTLYTGVSLTFSQ